MTQRITGINFAYRDGVIVHVDDVPNGLACNCTCPACGERLVAKQGNQNAHHFAHEGGSLCAGGLQTSLHLAAKAILAEHKRMRLPELEIIEVAHDLRGIPHSASRSIESRVVEFDEVSEEARFGAVIPDITARIGDRTLLVEVAVHHYVDEAKAAKLRAAGVACVEIALTGLLQDWDWETLRGAVIDDPRTKKWIHNPREEALRQAAMEEARLRAQAANRKDTQLEAEIATEIARRRNAIPYFNERIIQFNDFRHPPRREAESKRYAEIGPKLPAWLSASEKLGISWDEPPEFIGVAVPGETAFKVDRRVWQAAFFAHFIQDSHVASFGGKTAVQWCHNAFPRHAEFILLQKNERLLTPEEAADLPWAARAVRAYLAELTRRGFLHHTGDVFRILRKKT